MDSAATLAEAARSGKRASERPDRPCRAEGRAEGHEQGFDAALDAILAGRGFAWTETVREARKRSRATDADVISALLECENETDFRARLRLPPS